MNVPLSVVKANKTDQYVHLKNELEKASVVRRESYKKMDSTRDEIKNIFAPKGHRDPLFRSKRYVEYNHWTEALKIAELANLLVEATGLYIEADYKCDDIQSKIIQMERM
ncbi:hypothetical protein [Brevibacillus brevis]|uniref:hypothetical protein n=1 Tax=Brevibacillus brevis TaxID=1393 RepID=UPI0007D8B180|nr:hypothetical protein [Brevibacillus brevis]